jgi:hypothetical protein
MLASTLTIFTLILPQTCAFANYFKSVDRRVVHFSKIIDAEVIPDDPSDSSSSSSSSTTTNYSQMSLIEYSQKQDTDWKSMPVAFCDTVSNTYIDCNLAFYVKDPLGQNGQGAEYSLGVPCEVPIVVALEIDDSEDGNDDDANADDTTVTNLSKVIPINPENTNEDNISEDEKNEIFQMAARALMEEFGSDIRLKKTPRVLTIEGNLEDVIGDWKEVLLGNVVDSDKMSFDDALNMFDDDDSDDGEDYFDKIMRRDLGPDYMKLAEEVGEDDEEIDEELLKLFDSDSLNKDGDISNIHDFLRKSDDSNNIDDDFGTLVQQLKPSAALRLLNFMTEDGKEYTILRPVRPMLLLGKEDPEDYTRRILLTDEEMAEVLPRLESVCSEALEKAGFFLADGSKE